MRHLFQHLFGIHLRLDVLPAGDEHSVRERLLQRFAAPVMGTHPCTVPGVVLVQEHHPQLTGFCKNIQLGQQRLTGPLLGLQ